MTSQGSIKLYRDKINLEATCVAHCLKWFDKLAADYDALKARLDTAERELENTKLTMAGDHEMAVNDVVRQREALKAKLSHLERVVEGLPKVEGEITIQRSTWDGNPTGVSEIFLNGLRIIHSLRDDIADALAALLTHRKGMQ